jgi:hypothetical protein
MKQTPHVICGIVSRKLTTTVTTHAHVYGTPQKSPTLRQEINLMDTRVPITKLCQSFKCFPSIERITPYYTAPILPQHACSLTYIERLLIASTSRYLYSWNRTKVQKDLLNSHKDLLEIGISRLSGYCSESKVEGWPMYYLRIGIWWDGSKTVYTYRGKHISWY